MTPVDSVPYVRKQLAGQVAGRNGASDHPPHPADAVDDAPAAPHFPLLDDVEIERIPKPVSLVDGLLVVDSVAEIHGAPAGGKSFFVLDVALCTATGRPFHGRQVRRGPVVYVAAEGSAGLGVRVRAWKYRRGVEGRAGVHFATEAIHLLDPTSVTLFIAAVRQLDSPPVLIVIDTLARCMAGGDENSAKDMGIALQAADRIRRETGATVLLVHHTRKDGESERGSTALRGGVDTMIALRSENGLISVTCEKMKDGPDFERLDLALVPTLESCVLELQSQALELRPPTLTDKQRQALIALQAAFLDDGATATQWQEASRLSESTFHYARTHLVRTGYVKKLTTGRGARYVLGDLELIAPTPSSNEAPTKLQASEPHPDSKLQSNPPPLGGLEDWSGASEDVDGAYAADERRALEEGL